MLVHRLRGLRVGSGDLGVCGCRGERGITTEGGSLKRSGYGGSSLGKSVGNSAKRLGVVKSYSLTPQSHRINKPLYWGLRWRIL